MALGRETNKVFDVTAAGQYAASVANCPLRFVLGDDLTRASAELAFADGARLAGCLDLLRVPATRLWVEWNDEVHKKVICEAESATEYDSGALGRAVGVFLRGTSDGLSAVARTFWADGGAQDSDVIISPIETHIDLRARFEEAVNVQPMLSGGLAAILDGRDQAMSTLLECVRFRFDDEWAAYYRAAAIDADTQRHIVHSSLAAVARDPPLLLAFFLLLSANNATRSMPISRSIINRKRHARGHGGLLDHIEVHASLDASSVASAHEELDTTRRSPRLHHVRGHLVRRDNCIFWRTPHLRGSASQGIVRSRTVCLSFARRRTCAAQGRTLPLPPT
ncbi:MAG TPA: hypothetical protein VGO37_18875 [Steroidobacteraceae bacterium]|nr:hypothetical protein [Steroidobacteraceae bacterium]